MLWRGCWQVARAGTVEAVGAATSGAAAYGPARGIILVPTVQ